ncbi:MAG: hypothetical protein WC389_12365 [Lutibacter sp.]|jgi:hypothetical protein
MRQAKCIALLGQNGTGKTHLIQNEILPKRESGLILTPDGDTAWNNLLNTKYKTETNYQLWDEPRLMTSNSAKSEMFKILKESKGYTIIPMIKNKKYLNNVFEAIYYCFHNGFLIFDDSNLFLPANIDGIDCLHSIFGRRRQMMADIILTAHSFRDYNPGFISYTSEIVLFKTSDHPELRKSNFGNDLYNTVLSAFLKVKEQYVNDRHAKAVIKLR